MQLPGADPETAAVTIERLRREPQGVLIQTTHWQERLSRSLWAVAAVVVVVVIKDVPGADARGRLITLGVLGVPVLLVLAYWTFVRGRSGIVATRGALHAKGAFSRPIPLSTDAVLEEGALATMNNSVFVQYRGLLMRGSKWQTIPGLAVRAAATNVPGVSYREPNLVAGGSGLSRLITRRPSRLMTRPIRPWYLPPARATVHDDVVWVPGDDARAIRAAIGLAPVPAPGSEHREPSPANRLERWNRKAA